MTHDLRAYFESRIEAMVALTGQLAAIESPTDDKAAVDAVGARAARELSALDAQLVIHSSTDVGDMIEARWNAGSPGRPLLILCHMDTVHPIGTVSRNPIRLEGDRLYGPGTHDMKGSIAVAIEVMRGLRALGILPERPITLLLNSDEETGSFYSRDLIQERAREAALALVMEAAMPDGSLKTWRKSVAHFVVQTTGVAAHAGGAHEFGVNAIEEMAHQVLALQRLTDYEQGTTVNVGVVSGGTRSNVVPDQCKAHVDVRAMTRAEMERITRQVQGLTPALSGTRVEVQGGFARPPMERDARMIATFEQAKAIAAQHGMTLNEGGTGGASDGNYTAAVGTPTLDGLGPLGDGAHSEREYVKTGGLVTSATLLAALLLDWPHS